MWRGVAVFGLFLHVAAWGQPAPEDGVRETRGASDAAESRAASSSDEATRDPLRQAFVEARGEFADVTAAALTSEELKSWVAGLSNRVRQRRIEKDLWEAQASLQALEQSGGANTERAHRLAESIAALQRDAERLRTSPNAAAAVGGLPDQETVRRWLKQEMAEETNHLADTLSPRELERRTRRLHRLAALARFAGGLRTRPLESEPRPKRNPDVVQTAGTDEKEEISEAESLGEPTRIPPTLPEPAKKARNATSASDTAPVEER
jgi:hypothetical protein